MSDAAGLYLGRALDPATGKPGAGEVRLDPAELTTHAVIVGMTGSGKTGLAVDLLEEAALAGIPALVVDPKGEMGNLALTFPELRPADFQPWLPPGDAERAGQSADEHARSVAERWRAGLAEWGLDGTRIRVLREAADVVVYTPGSRTGASVDVLASFAPPPLSWDRDEEALLESIRGAVTALLSLVDVEADPLTSREHILLSHLVEHHWRAGAAADLATLIRGLQQPPFRQLGVFDVEEFFPARDRMKLALALNGLLAAPGFAAWREGEPLDPETLLHSDAGKPRLAVFHLGHLAEREKLFFTTLLLAAVNTWMRRRGGSSRLRALLYVDEAVGMIPPYPADPPTKGTLLLLAKQARAFGVGLVLGTQNPVDVDYKVLTNAGTWFVGRLQTQNDKDRVLEGLTSAAAAGASRAELDRRIGALSPRTFLLYRARGGEPVTFQTRWAMSYLRGPLTREDVERLRSGAEAPAAAVAAPSRPDVAAGDASQRETAQAETAPATAVATGAVAPPAELPSLFLAPEGWKGLGELELAPEFVREPVRYVATLYGAAAVRYDERAAGLNVTERAERLLHPIGADIPPWAESRRVELGPSGVASSPPRPGRFEPLPDALRRGASVAALRRDFAAYLLATSTIEMHVAPDLKLASRHDEARAEFEERVHRERSARRDADVARLRERYATKAAALRRKLEKERADLASAEATHSGRKREEVLSGAESVFGFLLGRKGTRAISQASRQRRMTETAGLRAARERDDVEAAETELAALDTALEADVREIEERHGQAARPIETRTVPLEKYDIRVETLAILWIPVVG